MSNLIRLLCCFLTIRAPSLHFYDRTLGDEILGGGASADSGGEAVVIDMDSLATIGANQKDAIVHTAGMGVHNIGIGAFDTDREIVHHEQVEDAINAVGRNSFAPRSRYDIGYVISGNGLVLLGQCIEDRRTHLRPLLATILQDLASLLTQGNAGKLVMMMLTHPRNVEALARHDKS